MVGVPVSYLLAYTTRTPMGELNNNNTRKKCRLTELLIFVAAIVAGTACSICSKTMMELHGIGMTGQVEKFSKPLFQTFGMFLGMVFGLVMHWAVLKFKIPFPGYEFVIDSTDNSNDVMMTMMMVSSSTGLTLPTERDPLVKKGGGTTKKAQFATPTTQQQQQTVPTWMYFFLAISAVFDLLATVLCMCGLRYIDVSIYQMLRGSGIIFVALMKQHVLRDQLYNYQWVGVLGNVTSVIFVGATAILSSEDPPKEAFGWWTRLDGCLAHHGWGICAVVAVHL